MFALVIKLFFIHLFALASPGPDFFFVARKAITENQRNAVLGIVGIILGLVIWLSASLLGLAILFKLYPPIESAVLLLGGGYLTYLGSLMLRVKQNISVAQISGKSAVRDTSPWANVRQGFLVNLANAKAIIYFSGIFSLLVASLSDYLQIGLIAVMILLESFLYFYIIARIFSQPRVKSFYLNYSRYIDNLSGLVFIGFGLFLIYSALQLII
ncbi:resistance to homoserine/threonine (RhtB) family protein [Pasteurella testudinis DSM 23072]|uniref:Resistance to homoserine/threonine (RhtB) family protein n=1 Tax=Pasteurella testudinis DSM 23072 TaxID=1122938 RepID=A0A1W1UIZ5_9PAST|nr:LysE family transporter [Pasteurella testudinis]SMB81076.1 resistance to homoserine/threonine (RhtB) family protein [Pasteurella testudinis DSM 23072]SUB51999.1 threonine efflux protein [Pasteurella testudinis]